MSQGQNKFGKVFEYVKDYALGIMAASALLLTVNLGLSRAWEFPSKVKTLMLCSSIALVISIVLGGATMTGIINHLASQGETGKSRWFSLAQYSSNCAVWAFVIAIIIMLIQLIISLRN